MRNHRVIRGGLQVTCRLTALVLLLVAGGCNTVSYDLAELSVSPGGSTHFDDRDPYDWGRNSPRDYPVHGVDVSKFQREIDWKKVRSKNVAFAFIKATEGGDRLDNYFHHNWKAAKKAGIARGAYHFYYFCRPAIEQARWFVRNVPKDSTALPPVLDMEWNPLSPTCKKRPPAAVVQKEMRIFLRHLTRHYGKPPLIYTTIDFYEENHLSGFKGYQFWLRSTAGHPGEKYGRQPWQFWQYTGTGIVPGITGDADINVFNGDAAAWRKWLKANTG